MGCAPSKDLQDAAVCGRRRGTWNDLLANGLSVQADDPLKSSEAHYIAALFSANYGSVQRSLSFNHGKAAASGRYGPNFNGELSKKEQEQVESKAVEDALNGNSRGGDVASSKNVKRMKKKMVATYADCETINAWELMEGLDEGACLDTGHRPRMDASLPQSHSILSPIDLTANSRMIQACSEHKVQEAIPPSSISFASTIASEENRSWHTESLQRALSFKYMFSHEDDGCFEDFHMSFRSFSPASFSPPSSPDCSAAASLKDWLPPGSRKLVDEFGCTSHSSSSTLEALECNAMQPHPERVRQQQSGNNTVILNDVPFDNPLAECQPEDQYNNYETALFDPELVESLEKALAQLSKEEWNALRSRGGDRQYLAALQERNVGSFVEKGSLFQVTNMHLRRAEFPNMP